jgi:hypothetical protein
MFFIPKSGKKNLNNKNLASIVNEFSFAEFSSALEMLFAAKKMDNIKLKKGFINHSLDEYRHYEIFSKIKKRLYNKKDYELRFTPQIIYNKGYISNKNFLIEKKNLINFSVFIAANETIAKNKLENLNALVKQKSSELSLLIQEILVDEERHSNLSSNYSKKKLSKIKYWLSYKKEETLSNIRHLYANSLNKTQKIFYPIFVILLMALSKLSFKINLVNKNKSKNILENIDPSAII